MADEYRRAPRKLDARRRNLLGALLVVVLAFAAGAVAGALASPQPWQSETYTVPGQGSP
jgi:hypothetical protein